MENYLRHVFERLTSVGADRSLADRGVEITRNWIRRAVENGESEVAVIARHRRDRLPELLDGARRMVRNVQLYTGRTPRAPSPPPPPVPPADPFAELESAINHVREMETEATILEIQRDYPGGGITTPLQAAQGQSIAILMDMYGPVAMFLVRITPIIGDVLDLAEAILGRDLETGDELTEGERGLRAGFGIVGLITVAGRIVSGLARGVTRIVRAVQRAARIAGTTAEALTQSFRRFARFSQFRGRITRILAKIENRRRVSSQDLRLLRLFLQRLRNHIRATRGVTLAAVEAGGRVLARITRRTGVTVRVINRGGQLRFYRCVAGP